MTTKTTDSTEDIKVVREVVTRDWVELHLEYTKNLQNFENIKCRIGHGRNVREDETAGQAIDSEYTHVGAKLVEISEKIKNDLGY